MMVHLLEDEYARLLQLAEKECRSATQQAIYLIRRGLVEEDLECKMKLPRRTLPLPSDEKKPKENP
jgi:hypothetical protein